MKGTFFITGIDTNIGKSYATGWLAREWNSCLLYTSDAADE